MRPLELLNGPLESDENFSLTVVRSGNEIVLGRKTRGYGRGNLVLPGGKDHYYLSSGGLVQIPNVDNASREVYEELGLDIDRTVLRNVGSLHIMTDDPEAAADSKNIAIFEARCRRQTIAGSDELADARWYSTESLPYEQMPADYRLWLPHIVAGYAVTAYLETSRDTLIGGNVFRNRLDPLGRMECLPVEPQA